MIGMISRIPPSDVRVMQVTSSHFELYDGSSRQPTHSDQRTIDEVSYLSSQDYAIWRLRWPARPRGPCFDERLHQHDRQQGRAQRPGPS